MATLLVNKRISFLAFARNVTQVFSLSRTKPISKHATITRTLCNAAGVQYLARGKNKAIAYRMHHPTDMASSSLPGIVFLTDFQSNMKEPKSQALESYCQQKNLAFVSAILDGELRRFDYQGCGESCSDLTDATLTDWKGDVLAVIDQLTAGPQIMVGFGMGGWLMAQAAKERPHRVQAMVGIATWADVQGAVNRWAKPKEALEEGEVKESFQVEAPDFAFLMTQKFSHDIQKHSSLLEDDTSKLAKCPVRLLHGMQDDHVPYNSSIQLAQHLDNRDIEVVLVKNAGHQFDQPDNIQLLFEMLDYLIYGAEEARKLAISSWTAFSVYSSQCRHNPYV